MALTYPTSGSPGIAGDNDGTGDWMYSKAAFGAHGTQTVVGTGAVANGLPIQSIDGALVTLGAKADAKSSAYDATAITAMQVLKQLSYLLGGLRGDVAVAGTLTRPANVTAYSVSDALSNNGTAGSVTAQTVTITDVNDMPFAIDGMRIHTTDTGLAAGVGIRCYLYAADPTASTGIVGGDNAAFSTKKGSFIGAMVGSFRSFSDGGVADLVPEVGPYIKARPVSGAATVYQLFQVLAAFTPSANSTTLISTYEYSQLRS